jgi:hypothetical protein
VVPLEGESEPDAVAEFARQFDLSRPHTRRELKLTEEVRALAEHRAQEAQGLTHSIAERLRDSQMERHREQMRAEQAEAALAAASQHTSETMDREERLHRLINEEWLRALNAEDRRTHPLAYVLSQRFIETVEQQPDLRLERLAWVCAMVACGAAPHIKSLAPRPLLTDGPESPQRKREDGAGAWRCKAAGGAPPIHYWTLPNHITEFDELAAK